MKIEIIKPIKPINPKPMAATFAVVLNSWLSGFLKILQTLLHLDKNDFIFSIINLQRKKGF